MKQITIKKLTGKIVVKTGLHIGAGNDIIQIGGVDSPIVKNPLTGNPYIPGSSIKGKMRSLLEWKKGIVKAQEGEPCNCGVCEICRVFGCANNSKPKSEDEKKRGPSRLIVRDAQLSSSSDKLNIVTEEKAENTINRITAKANPRFIERVVPGVEFDFELSYRVIDTGDGETMDEANFKDVVIEGLRLLQNDYLGGGGTRGNGQIEFKDLVLFENAEDKTGKPYEL